jgi:hypothetical protein
MHERNKLQPLATDIIRHLLFLITINAIIADKLLSTEKQCLNITGINYFYNNRKIVNNPAYAF